MPFRSLASCSLAIWALGILSARANGVWLHVNEVAYPVVTLTVGWENGWGHDVRTGNHDAVWLFAKQRAGGGDGFRHAYIESITVRAGNFIDSLPEDRAGVFLIPAHGSGFLKDSCRIEIQLSDMAEPTELRFFAVEMVYCPAGTFTLGDGASNHSFVALPDSAPVLIDGQSDLTFGNQPGEIVSLNSASASFRLPPNWPQGAQAFYVMKYELSQSQYRDFFNTLTEQQRSRLWALRQATNNAFALDTKPHRNYLSRDAQGYLALNDSGRHLGCNYLNWDDLLAWLDWAGLRPITELEYEKACRGPELPIPKEFAWGTQRAFNAISLTEAGSDAERPLVRPMNAQEGISVFGGFFGQPYLDGPVRQGFAASDTTHRVSSGAGYFGAFELSGSLWEMTVMAASGSVSFTVQPGDGVLSLEGLQNQGWPGSESAIVRGGGCNSLVLNSLTYAFRDLAVSDRFYHLLGASQRLYTTGGRGGR